MLVAVISDTHMTAGGRRTLPPDCIERLRGADLILHSGDVCEPEVLEELAALGPPVEAIHGNVDAARLGGVLPATRLVPVGGASVALVHDPGPAKGRFERLRGRFAEADAVVFGHTHMPEHEQQDGFQIFNPGSPTERRRAPHHTMGLLRAHDGKLRFEHLRVGS